MNKAHVSFGSKVANLARKAAMFSTIMSNSKVVTSFSQDDYDGLVIQIRLEVSNNLWHRLWYKFTTDYVTIWLNSETINSIRNEAKYKCKCDDGKGKEL